MTTIIEIKTGIPWKFDLPQLAAYMELVKLNPTLGKSELERIEILNEKKENIGHEYQRNGKTLPGVTEILSIYQPWDFPDPHPAKRGSWIHRLCAKYDLIGYSRDRYVDWIKNDLPGEHPDGEFGKQCILSYIQFLQDYELESIPVKNEVSLASKDFAGTMDKIFMTEGKMQGYLVYLGKKHNAIPISRRAYWMSIFNSAKNVWHQTDGKSRGFKQKNKNQEIYNG
jgi:hypothetical protein